MSDSTTYILSSDGYSIFLSSEFTRFYVREDLCSSPEAHFAVSGFSDDLYDAVVLGAYPTMDEAKNALYDLFCALRSGRPYFEMPEAEGVVNTYERD